MDAMHAALKSKRSSAYSSAPAEGLMADAGQGASGDSGGMHGLVQSLSADQKQELMHLLSKDTGGQSTTNSKAIEKGAPSDEERSQIEARMEGDNGADEMSENDADDAAMSMLDSRDKQAGAPMGQPRNLGERVKMSIASKLKGKGKL